MLYYFKYYVGRENLFSLFNVRGTAPPSSASSSPIRSPLRYGKRNLFIGGLVFTIVFTAAFAVLPPAAVAPS